MNIFVSSNFCCCKERPNTLSVQTCGHRVVGKADLFESSKEGLGAAVLEVQGRQREAVVEHEGDGGPGEGEGRRVPPHRLELVQRDRVHRIHRAVCAQRHVSQRLKSPYLTFFNTPKTSSGLLLTPSIASAGMQAEQIVTIVARPGRRVNMSQRVQ